MLRRRMTMNKYIIYKGILGNIIFKHDKSKCIAPTLRNNRGFCSACASVSYPQPKPKYPPGSDWHGIEPRVAWKIHERATELANIPKVKERLESIAGSFKKRPILWRLPVFRECPGLLPYTSYITKTHITDGLPNVYDATGTSAVVEHIVPFLSDLIVRNHEESLYRVEHNERYTRASNLFGDIMDLLYTHLAASTDHLLYSQLDKDVWVETFWKKNGFKGGRGLEFGKSLGLLTFSIRMKASYIIRTEEPLPEFVPLDGELATGSVAEYHYEPTSVGVTHWWQRPTSISGHWIGDQCEFHQLNVQVLDFLYERVVATNGPEVAARETLHAALVTGFASTVSQAHNQGFHCYADVVTPFVSQVVITDGRHVRLAAFQLNTLHAWRPANPRRNLFWAEPWRPLYGDVQGGRVLDLDTDILHQLVQFAVRRPLARPQAALRPLLADQPAPKLAPHMNDVGEEPPEHPKVERWQYPKNPVYFR